MDKKYTTLFDCPRYHEWVALDLKIDQFFFSWLDAENGLGWHDTFETYLQAKLTGEEWQLYRLHREEQAEEMADLLAAITLM